MGKPTDVKLEENLVRVTGWQLFLDGADLIIDAGDYGDPERKMGKTGPRRAIAHGRGDKLILNYGPDYTGGTLIQGTVTTEGDLNCKGTLNVENVVLWSTIHLKVGPAVPVPQNLWDILRGLRERIDQLDARITKLEQKK